MIDRHLLGRVHLILHDDEFEGVIIDWYGQLNEHI